jgi:hypothetical protein
MQKATKVPLRVRVHNNALKPIQLKGKPQQMTLALSTASASSHTSTNVALAALGSIIES